MHHLFGKAIQIINECGWCTDAVTLPNAKMGKIRPIFDDRSDDHLAPEEIDSVEVICV